MRHGHRFLGLLLLAVVARAGWGQTAGMHRGFLLGIAFPGWNASTLVQLDSRGTPSVFPTRPNSPWTLVSDHRGMTVDVDNRKVLVPAWLDATLQQMAIVQWDPSGPGVVSTLWTGPSGQPLTQWTNWTLNSDGDPVTVDAGTYPYTLSIYDRFFTTWKRVPLPLEAMNGLGGFVWDKARGGYMMCGQFSPSTVKLQRVSYDGRSVSLLATGTGFAPEAGGDQAGNGDWICSSAPPSGAPYYRVKAGTSVFTPGPTIPPLVWLEDVTNEKWAVPGEGFFGTERASQSPTVKVGGIFHVDPTSSPPVVSTIWAANIWVPGGREVTPLYSRDLVTYRTGLASWSISVNPENRAFAGKPYLVAASLTGARPPIRLADGREIFLVPDALTALTVMGPFAPFLKGNIGTLNQFGRGQAALDFSAVGKRLNGVVVHLCGVILDPSAPHGIGWVLDPWAFVIDVR